jgi:hypothetical protein
MTKIPPCPTRHASSITRCDFHTGLTSYDAAINAARDALSDDKIRMSEDPQVQTYYITTKDGRHVQRWKITLAH